MTSRELTTWRPVEGAVDHEGSKPWTDRLCTILYGAIGWPWLLRSLWGGTRASKARLLQRLDLGPEALPHLGSWKADTGFLNRIVDAVEELRPATVVELGSGASSLVCARALQLHGGGRLLSFDQHAEFVTATAKWLQDEGLQADMRHAPLVRRSADWPGTWYDLGSLPDSIDLLIIDGPPWVIHPFVRGAADALFDRLSPGGIVLLDDADRPGERIVARRWRRRWPQMSFERLPGSTKGTLIGRKPRNGGNVVWLPERTGTRAAPPIWRRAAAAVALVGCGWLAHDVANEAASPAQAASFVNEASASYDVSLARQRMHSQIESTLLDRKEIGSATGLTLPDIPDRWAVGDVQVFPSAMRMSVAMVLITEHGETVSLFIKHAETPAGDVPLLARGDPRSVAFWEKGPVAYALTGELGPERMLALSAELARAGNRS